MARFLARRLRDASGLRLAGLGLLLVAGTAAAQATPPAETTPGGQAPAARPGPTDATPAPVTTRAAEPQRDAPQSLTIAVPQTAQEQGAFRLRDTLRQVPGIRH